MNCHNPGVLSATNDMCDELDDSNTKANSQQPSTTESVTTKPSGVLPYAVVNIQHVRKLNMIVILCY